MNEAGDVAPAWQSQADEIAKAEALGEEEFQKSLLEAEQLAGGLSWGG